MTPLFDPLAESCELLRAETGRKGAPYIYGLY